MFLVIIAQVGHEKAARFRASPSIDDKWCLSIDLGHPACHMASRTWAVPLAI